MNSETVQVDEGGDDFVGKLTNLERQIRKLKETQAQINKKIKLLELEKETVTSEYNVYKFHKQKSECNEWIDTKFEWTDKLHKILKEKFNFTSFRPKQLAAINATLSKKDALLLMPTGGGKSLIYQISALINNGLTLVVSPLLSLIEDQLIALKKFEIPAASINSSSSKAEKQTVFKRMIDEKNVLKLLFVTPEWIAKSKLFMSSLQKCFKAGLLDRIAIDEVHCCSTWGHDFRPEYNYLGLLKPMFPGVPFLGLTATATMSVLLDTQKMLGIEDCAVFTAPFNRPNLYYKVVHKPPQKEKALKVLANLILKNYANGQSGIVYTTTVKETEELALSLREKGIRAGVYHAQMEPDFKKKVHQKWLTNKYQVVVATLAFGMGIDKPDVRFVIHFAIPKSMEGLYQESGRAGRDGQKADCILMYSLSDYLRNVGMASSKLEEKNLRSVLEYCLEPAQCRRALIAKHFEETWQENDCKKMCDHCKNSKAFLYYDITKLTKEIRRIIEISSNKDTKLTLLKLLDCWYDTGPKAGRISSVSVPKFQREYAEQILSHLLSRQYLQLDKSYNAYNVICYLQVSPKRVDGGEKIEILVSSDVELNGCPKREYREIVDLDSDDDDDEGPEKKKSKIS